MTNTTNALPTTTDVCEALTSLFEGSNLSSNETSWNTHQRSVIAPDGRGLWVNFVEHKNNFEITGLTMMPKLDGKGTEAAGNFLPSDEQNGLRLRINVSATRGIPEIVREVRRRLLPSYKTDWEAAKAIQLRNHLEHQKRLADFNAVRASVGLPCRTEICQETIKFGDGWLNFRDSYGRKIHLEIWSASVDQLEQIVTILKADQTIHG
jgi:hypothetical protein